MAHAPHKLFEPTGTPTSSSDTDSDTDSSVSDISMESTANKNMESTIDISKESTTNCKLCFIYITVTDPEGVQGFRSNPLLAPPPPPPPPFLNINGNEITGSQ